VDDMPVLGSTRVGNATRGSSGITKTGQTTNSMTTVKTDDDDHGDATLTT
jgi:hypothetical protein